jgi:hypothetical protein
MDENLLKMDIDAAEKHTRDWFGDHASWSHEQLLNLVYGISSYIILQLYADNYRGGSHFGEKSPVVG